MSLLVVQDNLILVGMQKGRGRAPIQESISKPILLALITALVIGVVAPLVIPHATHPSMIYHILLHIAGLTIAIFLTIVSFLAYSRNTTARILLMAIGFTTLTLVEFFYLLQADGIAEVGQIIIPAVNIELSHVILLLMVSLFGLGVLKVSK
jgi:predicted membrane chloride channel (bestrophin family)